MSDQPLIEIELNPRERRLYDRLRAQVIAPDREAARPGFRDLLLLLPDLAVLLMRLVRDERVPLAAKLVALAGVGYLLSPIDLFPEVLIGPLGLIDDLLVVGAALSSLMNQVHPDVVRAHWSGTGDALTAIRRVTDWSETLVRTRVASLARGVTRLLLRR
ncbi:MAG: DUF1232 domain-containing protein [Deltaproteobacteria bacterium]|nr:MAG: DUF1232 domain-containing protein [Deltaproteobacteria bacterium]